jgi:glutathione peroxidase
MGMAETATAHAGSSRTIYDFELPLLGGEARPLSAYRGQVVLIVNTASKCGLTPQYAGLQRLHERFGEKGLALLGFPCNQFGEQEPGTADEIESFCSVNYGVTFPMFGKLNVNEPDQAPLYAYLTSFADEEGNAGPIQWNFEKFLIGRDGRVVRRIRPRTEPEDPALVAAIEEQLRSGN